MPGGKLATLKRKRKPTMDGTSPTELRATEEDEEQLGRNAMEIWKEMREAGILCDGVLRAESGGELRVHRTIMSACSPYFRALFTTLLHDGPRVDVLLPGVSYEMLKLIVHFAYTNETLVNEENVTDLLPAADQFNVVDMIRDCSHFIMKRLDVTNCISIRQFARDFFCRELEDAAHGYLMVNFARVAETSDELLELPVEQVVSIFNAEELNISNEKVAWEAVVRWVDHNPERRRQRIVDLMRCVRLGLLDAPYFMEQVKVHRYVEGNELCKPLVIETLRFLYDLEMIETHRGVVPTPFLARPRIPHEIMFAIGGWSGGAPTSVIETYDTRADRWIRVNEVDVAGSRAYHECVVIGYEIFVIGGFNGTTYFSSCRCFHAVTKSWREISPMHNRRCYVSAAVVNDVIYAMGGYDGHHRQNTVETYDYDRNQWDYIAPMNAQRSDACATTLSGSIYITGGFNGTECLSSCEVYIPEAKEWSSISPMRNRRSGVSCIGHNGQLFALGGFNGDARLCGGEKYNPITDQWTSIPDMFNPRSNFAIEVMDDMIFVVGGFNGVTTIHHVECFDENTEEWYEATDMNQFRSALSACVISGLPNVRDYIHQNRDRLMEEKRQKLLQMKAQERDRNNNDDDI